MSNALLSVATVTVLCILIWEEIQSLTGCALFVTAKLFLGNYRLQCVVANCQLKLFHFCMCALLLYKVMYMYMENPEVLIHKRCSSETSSMVSSWSELLHPANVAALLRRV